MYSINFIKPLARISPSTRTEYHKQLSTVCCAAKSEWSQSPEADERSVVKISSGSTCCSSEQGLGVGLASFSLNFPLIYSGTGGAKPVHTCKPYIYIEDSSTQRLASMQTQQRSCLALSVDMYVGYTTFKVWCTGHGNFRL